MNTVVMRGEKTRFSCTRCGLCCSSGPNVVLTVYDVCRIAKYMGVKWRDLVGKYIYAVVADYVPVIVLRGLGDKCVFLKTQSRLTTCSIYPARPMRCRLYPFLPIAPRESNKLEVSSRCPGVKTGNLVEPPWSDLENYLQEVREHYRELYNLIFEQGLEPVRALEHMLDYVCTRYDD